MSSLHFSFGQSDNNKWRPWDYERRLVIVKGVEDLKKKLSKSQLAANTKRDKITSFIAEKQS